MSVPQHHHDSAAELVGWLGALRARARALLITLRLSVVLAVFLAAALAGGILDYLARFPAPIRIGAWSIACATLGFALWKLVLPAIRLRPGLTDIALRVEQARPDLKGLLAAAVDFESRDPASSASDNQGDIGPALERIVVQQAVGAWRATGSGAGLVHAAPTIRTVGWLILSIALCLAPAMISTSMWWTGAQRILTPWSGAAWPKRTGVADITAAAVHPLGSALPFRAALTKWPGAAEAADITVRYRMIGAEGTAAQWRRELLTMQDRTVPQGPDGAPAPIFERLVDPAGTAIEYRFETEDDASPWTTITLVEPPRIDSAAATIIPPPYTGLLESRVDLGAGLDERAVAPPMLAGSRIRLDIRLNKDARLVAGNTIASLVGDAASIEAESVAASAISADMIVRAPVRIPITLIDEHGIESVEAPVFVFGAQPDNPPAAAVTEPAADLRVIASAALDLVGEGRDDVGLRWVGLVYQHLAVAGRDSGRPSQPGGAVEPAGPEVELPRVEVGDEPRTTLSVRHTLDLTSLSVAAGDEVHINAIAQDRFLPDPILGALGRPEGPARSTTRIIRIISDDQLLEEIREALTEVRQAAIRAESTQQQAGAGSDPAQRTASADARRAQGEASDRLARQQEALARIDRRVDQNRLADQGLAELLAEATETLGRAAEASDTAAAGLERSAAEAPQGQAAPVDQPTAQAQDRALEETRRLIELLDRGEDTWVVESRLRQMLQAQQELQNRAVDAARQTAGRSNDQLSPEERAVVAQIAQDQDQLADEFQRLLEEMTRREQDLRDADPDAAAGMRAAAERARADQTEQAMRQAAQQAQQNQMSNAGEQQSRAAESLQQMLQDMQAGQQQRDERLRRMLRDLIASIDGLIKDQEAALADLTNAAAGERSASGLDTAMIALNRNTAGVADLARAGGAEAGVVAALIENAATAQANAVSALRTTPPDLDNATLHENRSLTILREARRAAEQEQQRQAQKEIDEKKAKLRAEYRRILETQLSIRDQTEEFRAIPELDRRDRVRLRRLSEPQNTVRDDLGAMVADMPELLEARVFQHAHTRLDDTTTKAAASLDQADAPRAVARQDATIGILQGLVRALDESSPDEKKFDDGQSGGGSGGGGGGGSGQPEPLVTSLQELSLLRSIQTVVANETALADADDSPESRLANLRDLASQQRELADVAGELLSKLGKTNPTDILPRPENPDTPPAEENKDKEQPPPTPPSGGTP